MAKGKSRSPICLRPQDPRHPLSTAGTENGALTTFRACLYKFLFFGAFAKVNKIFFTFLEIVIMLGKNVEITKDNVFEYIIACSNALDKLRPVLRYVEIPLPYWLMAERERLSREALSHFKTNDSHFMYRNKSGGYRNY